MSEFGVMYEVCLAVLEAVFQFCSINILNSKCQRRCMLMLAPDVYN